MDLHRRAQIPEKVADPGVSGNEPPRPKGTQKMNAQLPDPPRHSYQLLLTVKEVALVLRLSAGHVYDLVAVGDIPCVRVGRGRGSIRIPSSWIAGLAIDAATAKSRDERTAQ